VIDISDPALPTPADSATRRALPGRRRLGDRAFVADADFGLQVIDISDPTHPALVGACDTPGVPGASLSRETALCRLVSHGYFWLQVIDISDPTHPTLAGNYYSLGYAP